MVLKNLPEYLINSNENDLSEIIYIKNSESFKKPALFFDRDGVLIKECHYISDVSQVQIEKYAKKLVRYAYEKGWNIIVVSNQSGISRNILTWDDYYLITNKMISLFGEPNPFSAIYANSQGPNSRKKNWRKPSPEMILRAAKVINIDIKSSIIIGDRLTDLLSGLNAGIKNLVHTETGHGQKEHKLIKENLNFKKISNELKFIKIKDLSEFPLNYLFKV